MIGIDLSRHLVEGEKRRKFFTVRTENLQPHELRGIENLGKRHKKFELKENGYNKLAVFFI